MKSFSFEAGIFDMDGVITKTAQVHSAAWKLMFDEFLKRKEKQENIPFREFSHEDYLQYVDGKPRLKGIRSFLQSRGFDLAEGSPEDDFKKETIWGLGNRKNSVFLNVLETDGVQVYEPAVALIKKLKELGIKVGVVSSSKNCEYILKAAGVLDLFDTRVDGVIAEKLGLQGKPEGDIFVRAANDLGVEVSGSVVFEDAISGVQAGRNGGFGLVVGIARSDNIEDLLAEGADIALSRLDHISPEWIEKWFQKKPVAFFNAWENEAAQKQQIDSLMSETEGISLNRVYYRTPRQVFADKKNIVFFLDYDGTLTKIVDRPQDAKISSSMRDIVTRISRAFKTAIVSGRMREDVENLAGIKGIFYAGSHGFDISGNGVSMVLPQAEGTIPLVDELIEYFKNEFSSIEGVIVEEKKFSVAVHYRMADESKYFSTIEKTVEDKVAEHKELRLMRGKKVFEILPAIDWNKGKAVRWIMEALKVNWQDNTIVYIGDDTTDEDAFRAVRSRGAGILVSTEGKNSAAHFQLLSVEETEGFFKQILDSYEK